MRPTAPSPSCAPKRKWEPRAAHLHQTLKRSVLRIKRVKEELNPHAEAAKERVGQNYTLTHGRRKKKKGYDTDRRDSVRSVLRVPLHALSRNVCVQVRSV